MNKTGTPDVEGEDVGVWTLTQEPREFTVDLKNICSIFKKKRRTSL